MGAEYLFRYAVMAELLQDVGPPGDWVVLDEGVAAVLCASSTSSLRQWLHLVTQIGARLGPQATEAACLSLRESTARGSTAASDLAAAATTEGALLTVIRAFKGSEDLTYEVVRHENSSLRALSTLPAHDVANLVSLGYYKSAAPHHSENAFTRDVASTCALEVPQVMYAASLAESKLWSQQHLPWSFETALSTLTELLLKWGKDLVTLASVACTRGTSRIVDCAKRSVVEVCEALARLFRDSSQAAPCLAFALSETLDLDLAIAAARTIS